MQGVIIIVISTKNQHMRLFLSLFALSMIMFFSLIFSPIKARSIDCFPDEPPLYTLDVLQNDSGAWYYQILKDQKTFIIQKSIPAIAGNKAFIDSLQAAKVGNLMIYKLSKGVFPPAISNNDLDSLQIKL